MIRPGDPAELLIGAMYADIKLFDQPAYRQKQSPEERERRIAAAAAKRERRAAKRRVGA